MTDTYRVVSAAVQVLPASGTAYLAYRDAPFPADAVNLQDHLDNGFVEKVGNDVVVGGFPSDLPPADVVDPGLQPTLRGDGTEDPDYDGGGYPGPDDVDGAGPIPAKSADKATWVTFAVSKGATQDDAEAATKDELIELYGKA